MCSLRVRKTGHTYHGPLGAHTNPAEFRCGQGGSNHVADERITVLLLEDDPDVLEATRLVLEEEGFSVLAAADLHSAQQLALSARRCMVLLDLSLPGDPETFVRALHDAPDWEGQVLLFSAGDHLEERARALGADGAVAKPFEIDHLVEELRVRARGHLEVDAVWH